MKNALCGVMVLFASVTAHANVDPSVVKAIKQVKPADYPSANVVAIVSDQATVFQADGQFVQTSHSIQLVLTNAGKAEAASSSLYYTKDAEKMEVISAQVIKADGTIVPVDPKSIQDTEQSGEMNIYDANGRAVKVTFGNLAVGDAIDLTARLTRITPTRTNYFNDQFWFQSTQPMLEASYTVDGPATMPLTSAIYHPERGAKVVATKTVVGDRLHYTWAVHDAPQLVPEQGMAISNEVPAVVLTTDPSWEHFSKWWSELTEPQLALTDDIKKKAAELVKGKTTDAEKIKAMYDFVSSDIRYRGLGVGPRTGYTPRKAQETLTSRWGVCRDVSILLTSMLRSQGYTAFPVLTNVGDPVLPKIAYDGFNHAIVAMPKPGGGWSYLDPTAKNSSELIPGNEAEQSTLVSTPTGERLTSIPPVAPTSNLGHAIATSVIHPDGSLTSKVVFQTKGIFDMFVRSNIAMMSADQQRETVEEIIHAALPEAKLVTFETSSAAALWTPMQLTFEISVPHAAVTTGQFRLLRTLVTSGALGLVENVLPGMLGSLSSRKYMLDAGLTFQYDQDETVTVPADLKIVALPNEAREDSKVTSVSASCAKTNATTLACHRSFALKSRFVDPAQYTKLRDSLALMGRIARQPVVLGGK